MENSRNYTSSQKAKPCISERLQTISGVARIFCGEVLFTNTRNVVILYRVGVFYVGVVNNGLNMHILHKS